ncbi:hypothetical protein OD507_004420 [Salmonella enterica]|nr:hypothetical protein [Salmonella enterica]EJX4536528.1 hypothetical protein [Salmonella enterica]EKS4835972.1 hypothetical protein [Salmonella enterica]
MFDKFRINNFRQPCLCKGEIHLYVVIGEDQDERINDLGYIAQCNTCNRSSGMENSIYEAYNYSQSSAEELTSSNQSR